MNEWSSLPPHQDITNFLSGEGISSQQSELERIANPSKSLMEVNSGELWQQMELEWEAIASNGIEISPSRSDLLWKRAEGAIDEFVAHPDFIATLHRAFEGNWSESQWQEALKALKSDVSRPQIEIVSRSELQANGAYAKENNTIYLAGEFLSENSLETVNRTVLEEIGHYFDSRLNPDDSTGDEGDIFAAVVLGEKLDETQLQALKTESDRVTRTINGNSLFGTDLPSDLYYNPHLNRGLRDDFIDTLEDRVYQEVIEDFASVNNEVQAMQFSRNGEGDFKIEWGEVFGGGQPIYGASFATGSGGVWLPPIDVNRSVESILSSTSTNHKAKSWSLANALNQYKSANIKVNLAQHLDWDQASRNANTTFAQFIANTISHEVAHTFGLNEGYVDPDFLTTLPNITPHSAFVQQTGIAWDASALPFDLMMQGFPTLPNLSFSTTNVSLLKSSLGIHQESVLLQPILINHPTHNVSVTLSPLQVYGLGFNFHNNSLGIRV